jgi:site-specific recombinase XerD
VDLGELLITWGPAGRRGGWKPFLHHISKGQPAARRTIALKASRKLPRILTADEVQTILDACGRLRDRLLFAVLYDTGMRIGEALGLRHEDIAAAEREVTVFPRHNANGARTKSANTRTIPVSAELVRLYADYLHEEYGDLDSDYVFVNLWGRPHGRPLAYPAVYDLVCRLRGQTGIDFGPHWYRHTYGTRMINRDVPQEVVRRILDHDSSQMTGHYARLHDTTVRRHWEAARKVSITGQTVTLDPNGPLAEAAWAKQRLGRATQALPNGFCGLPVQKTCPHANACLTCPMFITTPEFLPQHRDHRQQIIQIISAAQARGQTRLAEMNQQVLANLDNIITGLQDDTGPGEVTADAS